MGDPADKKSHETVQSNPSTKSILKTTRTNIKSASHASKIGRSTPGVTSEYLKQGSSAQGEDHVRTQSGASQGDNSQGPYDISKSKMIKS